LCENILSAFNFLDYRTCKEELKLLSENSSGSTGAFLRFLCEYVDAIQFIVEILQLIQSENSYASGQTSLFILVEKLDISLRRMGCCYDGLDRELEVQVLELALLANLFRLSKIGICPKQVLDKLHWLINRLEGLCSDGSYEQSDFSREIKKAFGANSASDTLVGNIGPLLELFHLKPTTEYRMLKAIRAVLQVCDSENPLLYVRGLPVGIRFSISVWNISSHHRLWLRMTVGESIQYTFLELSSFGGDKELRTCSMVVPLYATPMVCSFVLRVCLVMECPYGGISTHMEGHGGPSDCVVQLSDELDVYFVCTGQK
jgi:integrator complex subunit 4